MHSAFEFNHIADDPIYLAQQFGTQGLTLVSVEDGYLYTLTLPENALSGHCLYVDLSSVEERQHGFSGEHFIQQSDILRGKLVIKLRGKGLDGEYVLTEQILDSNDLTVAHQVSNVNMAISGETNQPSPAIAASHTKSKKRWPFWLSGSAFAIASPVLFEAISQFIR
jgi:hypothetical protein